MYFSISKTKDRRYPKHFLFSHWVVSHDNGWTQTENGIRKGFYYSDIDYGNFCEIYEQDGTVFIAHDKFRTFPLYLDQNLNSVSSLHKYSKTILVDQKLIFHKDSIEKIEVPGLYDDYMNLSPLSKDECVNKIYSLLEPRFQKLKEYTEEHNVTPKVFLSGGVDTLLSYAGAKNKNIQCESIDYEHLEYDYFINHNKNYLKTIKALEQIHHWKDPTLLLTGTFGDEYLLRGPITASLLSAVHDCDLIDFLDKTDYYHKFFYSMNSHLGEMVKKFYKDRKALQRIFADKNKLRKHLLSLILNDHQKHHMGNTITWSATHDPMIIESIARLNWDDLLLQICDADINKRLIEKFDPDSLDYISRYKNIDERIPLENIT